MFQQIRKGAGAPQWESAAPETEINFVSDITALKMSFFYFLWQQAFFLNQSLFRNIWESEIGLVADTLSVYRVHIFVYLVGPVKGHRTTLFRIQCCIDLHTCADMQLDQIKED